MPPLRLSLQWVHCVCGLPFFLTSNSGRLFRVSSFRGREGDELGVGARGDAMSFDTCSTVMLAIVLTSRDALTRRTF